MAVPAARARAAPLRLAAFAVFAVFALFAIGGCDGKLIHLGDGRRDAGGGACPPAPVRAAEVLWTGDSWITIPGAQHTRVRDLARLAGIIGPDDDYVIAAQPASTMSAIAGQYDTQEAGATKVKILILDGGCWDTIVSNGSDASVSEVVATFRQHLTKIASDGTVEHIVYLQLPELDGITGVAALRLPMQQACTESAVLCHFLDLQSTFAGHPEYAATVGGIPIPTDAGATAIADAIWAVMQQGCIGL